MARPTAVIYQQLLAAKNAQSQLNTANSNSQVAKWNLWLWITAICQNLFEQLSDLLVSQIESSIANAIVFTCAWWVTWLKYFQYSAVNPQVIEVGSDGSLSYPVVNPTLNVISQAAVVPVSNRSILIKIATGSPPSQITDSGTLAAINSFISNSMIPGTQYTLIAAAADRLLFYATIYFSGAYSGVIVANVQAAITNYLLAIPFNGTLTLSDIIETILNVPGVNDVVLNNISSRQATQAAPPTPGIQLVTNNDLIVRNYQTYAGYIIPEDTAGYTLVQTLTFIAQ